VAEVVRRRYARVLNESKVQSPKSIVPEERASGEGSEATGEELQVEVRSPKSEVRSPKAEGSAGAEVRGGDSPLATERAVPLTHHGSRITDQASRITPPPTSLPDLILIDGGKGQLGAACSELQKLGLSHIPTIGLAKEFEEIYRPGQKEPLRLSHESGALKLLQRVRDESHRLANTYNAQLRLRKISESVLDEFPNIGQRRKAALLKRFGSVQRMRLASAEQIAEVPGFGGKAAAELKAFLEARQ
jgi:excinuclease ABC subunit C